MLVTTVSKKAIHFTVLGDGSFPHELPISNLPVTALQYDIAPTTFSTSAISTITIASQGQPSRKHPSGPLLRHFFAPDAKDRVHLDAAKRRMVLIRHPKTCNLRRGNIPHMRAKPAQPVQHSVITASSFGFFLAGCSDPLGNAARASMRRGPSRRRECFRTRQPWSDYSLASRDL